MKKILIFTLLLVATLTQTQAQIGDADAKIQYRQAQAAYEQGDYFKAYQTAYDLEKKMGKPTTTVAYLIVKSVYAGNQVNKVTPQLSHEYIFASYYTDKCNWLIAHINKATYPAEKYKEIQNMQQYFQQMRQKYASQKERTPEKAIAFLNDCAQKFAKNKYKEGPYKFLLLGNRLKIASSNVRENVEEAYHRFIGKMYKASLSGLCVFLDFSKINYINPTINYNNNVFSSTFSGYTVYVNNKKAVDYSFIHYVGDPYINDYNRNRSKLEKEWLKCRDNERVFIDSVQAPSMNRFTRESCSVFDFFDTTSQEFKDGKYPERIIEAFQYLIDYFPKAKSQQNNVQQDNSNGF